MTSAATLPRSVTVRVPAKVNLELRVGPRRADGFHALSTIYMAVGLFDEVTVAPSAEWEVTISGPYAEQVPTDATNLAVVAARTLAEEVGVHEPVSLRIHKEIPVAGGMAGGSADAAAALVACDHLWSSGMAREELVQLAAGLGSDVPFALSGGIAMGSGRGEALAPVLARGTFHWVFAVSQTGLSTPAVYAECDRLRSNAPIAAPEPSSQMMTALRSGDAEAVGRALSNDLQDAAVSLQPGLRDVLDAGLEFGALGGIVSGSGPTVAFLTASPEMALDLCVSLTASGVAGEVRRAKAPVHGAQVIPGPSRV
ncbi:4-(cytidine 5'-diphospho)-2-C-methyl-D-erythritol kinase [Lapillicoccus sp.]|uniref:4-(cytidine 5'-diphospho)-2-C-methyl-D-erythritol kinase n=1 Tax=Lapillicoccus sp. TaxID=1909287 RepID=UPI0039835147